MPEAAVASLGSLLALNSERGLASIYSLVGVGLSPDLKILLKLFFCSVEFPLSARFLAYSFSLKMFLEFLVSGIASSSSSCTFFLLVSPRILAMALPSSYVIMVSTRGLPFESFTDMTPELTPLRFIWARAF